ncbi:ABC transporter substrate-binding protein [Microbacterium soli]|uniref:Extracellular solute-binding protein n=1 Tax=Microbacterium soli TaxID=446075 RepID=A0ABP7MM38_9MICO
MKTMRPRAVFVAALATAASLLVTGCGSGAPEAREGDGTLTVWSLEVQPDRIQATQAEAEKFEEATGIEVEIVPVEEDQISQLMAAASLSGELPDVIGSVSLGLVRSFQGDDYLNTDAAAAVIDQLGEDTWASAALELTRDGDDQLSVPSDAWGQIIVYRTDLFEAAGLTAPDTYESLLAAAEALTGDGNYGISLASDASSAFTQQTFEALALGNNCQLVDDGGNATLDSEACLHAIELYERLATDLSPDGTQTVESTRASYFSGQAAMTIWSTFLLDELAGLRNDAAPSCAECEGTSWLAEHTGIVPRITGPDAGGIAGSYGEMTSWVITSSAAEEDATAFVEFMLSDGYSGWFGMAPEGKFPVRSGTADDPSKYTDEWLAKEAGVDTKAPLAEIYGAETIDAMTSVPQNLARWALPQGQGAVLGPLTAQLPIPKILADLSAGSIDAATAQEQMQQAVTELLEGLR